MLLIRASSFIENFPQIGAKPIAFQWILLGKLSRNQPFFTIVFQWNSGLENSREIGRFFREFVPENPAKFDIFFRDLPEALTSRPKLYNTKFNCHFITSIFDHLGKYHYFIDAVVSLLKPVHFYISICKTEKDAI